MSLEELFKKYKQLYRRDVGEAFRFYADNIFPLIAGNVRLQYERMLKEGLRQPPLMAIISVGHSWQPVALITSAVLSYGRKVGIEPSLAFIMTEETRSTVEWVSFALSSLGLDIGDNLIEVVLKRKDDIEEIERRLLSEDMMRLLSSKNVILADVTGGTKLMSAGLLYSMLSLKYLDENLRIYVTYMSYGPMDREINEPEPGHERLILVGDPMEVMDDMVMTRAVELMRAGWYRAASKLFQALSEATDDYDKAGVYRFLLHLSEAEEAAESYDYLKAAKILERRLREIKNLKNMVRDLFGGEAASQIYDLYFSLSSLSSLADVFSGRKRVTDFASNPLPLLYLIADFLIKAGRLEERREHTVAALLYYRALEMCFQALLICKYGVDPSNLDVDKLSRKIGMDGKKLEERFLEEARLFSEEVGEKRAVSGVPSKLPLIDSYLLLRALGDTIASEIKFRELYNGLEARNSSILVHGFKVLRPGDKSITNLKNTAYRVFRRVAKELGSKRPDLLLNGLRRFEDVATYVPGKL
ncbi:MAG: TIGR02710 family CRISPR-associated protein [Thermoprotei archaeon]|nr:MAG: TIGR02710 family CRISPR-associated protein [Thermoprotei archaeon]